MNHSDMSYLLVVGWMLVDQITEGTFLTLLVDVIFELISVMTAAVVLVQVASSGKSFLVFTQSTGELDGILHSLKLGWLR